MVYIHPDNVTMTERPIRQPAFDFLRALRGSLLLCLLAVTAMAPAYAEIIENDPRVTIKTIEPGRDVGYTVGDILTRTVILEAPRQFTLFETSIPIAGNEKKRRGKGNGIELKDVSLEKRPGATTNTYTLKLSYQVFTNNIVARPASLPPEFVKFGDSKESFEYRIPSWSFRISPLAVYGSVVVERDMSGFRGPLLMSTHRQYQTLWALLGIVGIAALGLLYVLGTSTWLPRMGGPFARALRDLKKLPDTAEGLAQAISRVHQAFNTTAGNSVFDTGTFVGIKPGFATAHADIDRFFQLSRTVFFEPSAAHGIDNPMVWLKQFCRRCRDCERGLK